MKKLLLSVSYTSGTGINGRGSFWADSYINGKTFEQKEGETIHDTVKRVLLDVDGAELSYNGKPQANMYIDTNAGAKIVGYIYRAKHYISDRSSNFQGYAVFDAWVTIKEVLDIELDDVENF